MTHRDEPGQGRHSRRIRVKESPGDRLSMGTNIHGSRRLVSIVGVIALLLALPLGTARAAGGILDLGKPTDTQSTNPYFPLGAFRHLKQRPGVPLPSGVTFFYSPRSPYDGVEEWPLLKALEQFGTLKGVGIAPEYCYPMSTGRTTPAVRVCTPPAFELSHAAFTSRYISARFVGFADRTGHCTAGKLSKADWTTLVTYGHINTSDRTRFCREWEDPMKHPGLTFSDPALFVGSYVQNCIELVQPGDLEQPVPGVPTPSTNTGGVVPLTGLPFAAVQAALAAGHNLPGNYTLVQDVNAEANIITALICRADGKMPKSACARPVITKILKRVKQTRVSG